MIYAMLRSFIPQMNTKTIYNSHTIKQTTTINYAMPIQTH